MSELFSSRLRMARGQRSQAEVCEVLEIKQGTYSTWELGKYEPPLGIIVKLAAYFGVTVDWLLTGREGVSTRLEYGMREMLFEARGATGLTVPGLAAKMGVDKREVEKIMNEGGNPSGALEAAFEKHLQPAIDAARSSAPGCPGCAALKSEVDFLRARLTEALSKIPTPPGN